MLVLLHDHPQTVTQEELQRDLLLLPEWRQQKVLSFRFLIDRVLSAKAYLLLCQGLRQKYGITEMPSFDYVGHEKPILRGYPDIHFNLSHCRQGVLCVIDDEPVGCDIEEIEPQLDLDLVHHCFNEQEAASITSSDNPCIAFTRLWTIKEAALKLTGEGISDDLPSLFERTSPTYRFLTRECPDHHFVYSVAREM